MYAEQQRYLQARHELEQVAVQLIIPGGCSESRYWQVKARLRDSELALLDFGARVVLPVIGACAVPVLQRGCPIVYRKSVLELLAMWGS